MKPGLLGTVSTFLPPFCEEWRVSYVDLGRTGKLTCLIYSLETLSKIEQKKVFCEGSGLSVGATINVLIANISSGARAV